MIAYKVENFDKANSKKHQTKWPNILAKSMLLATKIRIRLLTGSTKTAVSPIFTVVPTVGWRIFLSPLNFTQLFEVIDDFSMNECSSFFSALFVQQPQPAVKVLGLVRRRCRAAFSTLVLLCVALAAPTR